MPKRDRFKEERLFIWLMVSEVSVSSLAGSVSRMEGKPRMWRRVWQSSALIPMMARKGCGNEREREKEGRKGHTAGRHTTNTHFLQPSLF